MNVEASFRVTGKMPEIWHAESGLAETVSYRVSSGRTTIPLHLEPWGTEFVLLRRSSKAESLELPPVTEKLVSQIDGAWSVGFQTGRGALAGLTLDRLASWSEGTLECVKYFSGTVTCARNFVAGADWLAAGHHVWIDIGDVKNLAEVVLNGKSMGVAWHAPYLVDLSSSLRSGDNELVIKVTNAWVNRQIGDQQPGVTAPYTFADIKSYKATSALMPSGLPGAVRIPSIGAS